MNRAHECGGLDHIFVGLFDIIDVANEEWIALREAVNARARATFDEDFDWPLRKSQELDDVTDRADREDVLFIRIIGLRAALCGEQQLLVAGHRILERRERFVATDEQRNHHMREHDDVAQGEQGQAVAVHRL